MQTRYLYIDTIKTFALISIIFLHVSAKYVSPFSLDSLETWSIANIYNSISRAGVPLFFMISGTLFLVRDIDLVSMLYRTFQRLIIPLFVWTVIYILFKKYFISMDINIVKHLIVSTVRPEYSHLWFMYTLIGIYLLLPILKEIKSYKYFILLWITVVSLIPFLFLLIFDENIQYKRNAFIYIGFPVLGYILAQVEYSVQRRNLLVIMGILSLGLIILFTKLFSIQHECFINYFYYNINFLVIIYASTIFLGFKFLFRNNTFSISSKSIRLIKYLSQYSLGIYMIHMIILFFVENIFLKVENPIVGIFLESIFVLVISASAVYLLSKSPLKNIV